VTPARGALGLGLALTFAGWSLGSGALAIAGIGLVLGGAWGSGWSAIASRTVSVERLVERTTLVEGDDLLYEVRLRGAGLLPGTFLLRERLGPAGEVELGLRRRTPVSGGLAASPRGRYAIGPARVIGVDPLGLGRLERSVPAGHTVIVVPRVPVVGTLFHDGGRTGVEGRRALVGRGAVEPYGVREYEDGEPLRAVHWASSARRGRLMVRELQDLPDDEAVVLLDLDASGLAGPPGHTSIDEAVRVAAGIVRASAARGRRGALVVAGRAAVRLPVTSLGRDWEDALTALAEVEPTTGACTADVLRGGGRVLGRGALTLVTTRGAEPFAEALAARGGASLVAVDAPTYAGAGPSPPAPALLRLAAHGLPVAVVRCGDDLAVALTAQRRAAAYA
jgi:uncharacterized protein (DUF58 family)